jgi:hypothetical protein
MPVGAVLALAAGAATLVWPGVLAEVAYGCEPGAAVLLIVLAAQWVAHARYRRQVVFLPSFTRVKAGSSLVRGTVSRPRGEPSTVDAMPPGNSQWAGGPSKAEKSPG